MTLRSPAMPAGLLILATLAAYRATRLVTVDSLFERYREAWFDRFPPDLDRARVESFRLHGAVELRPRTTPAPKVSKAGQLIQCPWCIGFWITGGVVWVLDGWRSVPLPFLVWPALASAVGLLGMIDHALLEQ